MSSKRSKSNVQAIWEVKLRALGLGTIDQGTKISRQVFTAHNSNAKSSADYRRINGSLAKIDAPEHKKKAMQLYADGYSLMEIRRQLATEFEVPKTRSGMHKLIQSIFRKYPDLEPRTSVGVRHKRNKRA